jgi:hypothetical protein
VSKFDKIFTTKKTVDGDRSNANARLPQKSRPTKRDNEKAVTPGATQVVNGEQGVATTTRRGRPNGKRSDPRYVGFTTYIQRETHMAVKIALLQERKGRELSELVEHLLDEWVKAQ